MADTQAKLQALSEEYQKLQQDLQGAVASRQKLEAQRQENEGVQKVRFSYMSICCFNLRRVIARGNTDG